MSKIKIGNIKGPKGDKGEQGAVGPKGEQGIQGPVGPAGGVNSVNGKTGDVNIADALGYTPAGGENLVLDSAVEVSNNEYLVKIYNLSEPLKKNGKYTVTIWGEFEGNFVTVYIGGDKHQFNMVPQKYDDGTWRMSGTVPSPNTTDDEFNNKNIYVYGAKDTKTTIHKIKLERGTVTDPIWTPAPEDVVVRSELEKKIGSFDSKIENATINNCVITERLGHVSIVIYGILPNPILSYDHNDTNEVVLGTVKGITNPSYYIRMIVATQANHLYDKVNPCYCILNMSGVIAVAPTVNTDKAFIINIDYDV